MLPLEAILQEKKFGREPSISHFRKKNNKNEIGKVNIQIPSLAEQRKIGIFFYSLDRLITLHQRNSPYQKQLRVEINCRNFSKLNTLGNSVS